MSFFLVDGKFINGNARDVVSGVEGGGRQSIA